LRFVYGPLLFLLLAISFGLSQSVTTTMTPTGYSYPIGTSSFYTGCPNNGGTWLGRPSPNGCYTPTYYHLGYDTFNSSSAIGSSVYAASTGTVIYIDPNSSWTYQPNPVTDNTAVFIQAMTGSGTNYVMVYGHLLRSSVVLQVGDVVTSGTQIGTMGYWNPVHVHIGVWPNYTSLPPSPWGRAPDSQFGQPGYTYGTTDPLGWITGTNSSAKCQNGGTVEYHPGGGIPSHPEGTLFTIKNDPYHASGTVYVLYQGYARPISSASILYQLYGVGHGFDFRDVIQISQTEANRYPQGAIVNAPLPMNGRNEPDGRLIQQPGNPEISIVTDNGYRKPFASAAAFLNLGYQFCNVATASDYASYPAESPITQ
jgi:murein DD-endopeptidase MepM/ murein hydrolase activator NlpD